MNTSHQRRSMDATAWLSAGLAVLLALPLAPRVIGSTADWTRDELTSVLSPEVVVVGMVVHALASGVITLAGLYLTFDTALRLIRQQIARAANSLSR